MQLAFFSGGGGGGGMNFNISDSIHPSNLIECNSVLFCYSPPPHQKICKTVEIVPEKMKKSSIEILQILVLSKYN